MSCMQHQDQPVGGRDAAARRVEMAGEDLGLADRLVREEAIGGLGVGPVLAGRGIGAPTAPAIRTRSLRNRRPRRSSLNVEPASSWSTQEVASQPERSIEHLVYAWGYSRSWGMRREAAYPR